MAIKEQKINAFLLNGDAKMIKCQNQFHTIELYMFIE